MHSFLLVTVWWFSSFMVPKTNKRENHYSGWSHFQRNEWTEFDSVSTHSKAARFWLAWPPRWEGTASSVTTPALVTLLSDIICSVNLHLSIKCRLNYQLGKWWTWYLGAFQILQRDTTSGKDSLEGWIGKATSQPPLLIPNPWVRLACVFTPSKIE